MQASGGARGVSSPSQMPASTREVVATSRRLAPNVIIVARTRYVQEVEPLEELGADQVIPEEFETSLELVGRVLEMSGAPASMVLDQRRLR